MSHALLLDDRFTDL